MSDPAWVGAGRGDSVGTATIATDGTFTIADHGLDDGTPVEVDNLTGGADGVLREDSSYFVVNATTDTFELVSTSGDEVITFGSSGGADVHRRVPHYTAIELRRLHSGSMTKAGDRFGARSGIHPSTDPAVTLAGTTWTVEDIVGDVEAINPGSGPYRFAHPSESDSLDPADGSLDRVDALDLQIRDDDEDSSGFRRARVVYTAGSPDADPDPPAAVSNALRLATILVPAGGSPSPSITSRAPFTAAAGGVLPVRDGDEGPDAGRYHGMVRYRRDANVLETWDADASRWSFLSSLGGWHEIDSGFEDDVSSFDIDVTAGGRFPLGTFKTFKLRAWGRPNSSGSTEIFMRINDISSEVYHRATARIDPPTDTVDAESGIGPQWEIGDWGGGGAVYNPLEVLISTLSDICVAQWQLTDTENYIPSYGGGRIDAVAPVTEKITLFIGTGAGSEFLNIRWELEGYIPNGFVDPFSDVGPH